MTARCVVLAAGASALMAPVAPARPGTQLSAEVSSVERSPAMPFLPRPQKLKGMAGDLGAMTQIAVWIAVAECIGYLAILEMLDGSGRQPGDFGFDPLQIGGANDPEMQLKELENGRLAMLAFSGIVTQAVLTGKGFPYF